MQFVNTKVVKNWDVVPNVVPYAKYNNMDRAICSSTSDSAQSLSISGHVRTILNHSIMVDSSEILNERLQTLAKARCIVCKVFMP